MKFYDLHVHSAFSGGKSSLEELAKTAKMLGYAGFCYTIYYENDEQVKKIREEIDKVKKKIGIEIFLGIEARNIRELKKFLRNRGKFEILLARGGELKMNRFACEHVGVDILTHPSYERNDCGLNHVSAKFAAKNKVAIEINFREILISSKKSRAQAIKNFKDLVRLAKKYRFPLIINSGAISHYELCDPLVLSSFLHLLGLDLKDAKNAVSKVPKEVIERALEKKNSLFPGVRVIK